MRVLSSIAFIIACAVPCACKFVEPKSPETHAVPATAPGGAVVSTRNNSLSLLYEILRDEQNVSKLLIIKRDRKELHDLIKKISVSSGEMVKILEQVSKEDRTLTLKATDLPLGEKAARDAESKALTKELVLHSHGQEFEFKLLLTQAQAMEYACNLAKVAAINEPDSRRGKQFAEMSTRLHGLHEDVLGLLRQTHIAASH